MYPFVSIIVPIKNEERRLPQLLSALEALDYPRDRFEIIVADNGSTDRTVAIAREAQGVEVCIEPTGGSYAARNAGLRVARGEVIAFTDSDCTPDAQWLRAGVARIASGADLVAGAIHLELSRPSIDHQFDRKFFLQQRRWVAEKKAGATANLFARRTVIERVGGFSEQLTSGGDFAFCKAASEAGYSLVFEPSAVVQHPTRGFKALLRKARRIGGGKLERLRHTSTTSGDVIPKKRQLTELLAQESLRVQVGFLFIYGAVCLAGAYGALTYLARSFDWSSRIQPAEYPKEVIARLGQSATLPQ
jgi:glycosyltransferase involved in cell wall biosynthesis